MIKNVFYGGARKSNKRMDYLLLIILVVFFILIFRLLFLQVVKGDEYYKYVKASILRKIVVKAKRGDILDRNGVPIATTKTGYTVKFDNSMKEWEDEDLNNMFYEYFKLLDREEEEFVIDFPISKKEPYGFIVPIREEINFKKDMNLDQNILAEEAMNKLSERFGVDKEKYDAKYFRKIIAARCEIYKIRYKQYKPILIGEDIEKETMAKIEEKALKFEGIYIDVEPIRYYIDPEVYSHTVGYTGRIDKDEYMEKEGYYLTDYIGKSGAEFIYEKHLKGIDGEKLVEVDKDGRRVETLKNQPPKQGDTVTLTIDSRLQKILYDEIETELSKLLLTNFVVVKSENYHFTTNDLLEWLVRDETISTQKILDSTTGYSKIIKNQILSQMENKNEKEQKEKFADLIAKKYVSNKYLTLIMMEQDVIEDTYKKSLINGYTSTYNVLRNAIKDRQLKPSQTGMTPSEAAAVVVDVNTGDVLASVSYPGYDLNTFSKNFNRYNNNDRNYPQINKVLKMRKAPGSTFKMVTALAALEEKVINEYSTVVDKGLYTKLGRPAACWIYTYNGGTHGVVNVVKAIETSCNYFFYEMGYKLGIENGKFSAVTSIEKINKYGEMLGLSEKSGIELSATENMPHIANPEFKKARTGEGWYPGDSIRAAIGQSVNLFAPVHIVRYVAAVSTGELNELTILKHIKDENDELVFKRQVSSKKVNVDEKNLEIVRRGMLEVTEGNEGTAVYHFRNLEHKFAGKTGTAQETGRPSNGWFTGFMPYDKPEIAITVLVPQGGSSTPPKVIASNALIKYYHGEYDQLDSKNELIK